MSGGGFYSLDSLRGVHVLVVDHDDGSRALFTSILHYCGALVTGVSSPDAALTVMDLIKPDVVVVDMADGDKDGCWLLGEVRARKPEEGGVVPAIAVAAAEGGAEAVARARAAGFVACLVKPIDPWEFCRAITATTAT